MGTQDFLNISLAILVCAAGGLCINISGWFMAMAKHEKTKEVVAKAEAKIRGLDI